MDLNTEDLRLLIAVLERGSLRAGAKVLGLEPSAATRRIQRLEKELGRPVLHRHTRALRPTPEGAELAESGRDFLARLDALAQRDAAPVRGQVRVSVPVLLGHRLGPALLADLHQQYPELVVTLHLENARVDLLRDGVDVVLRAGAPTEDGLVVRRLGTVELGLYAAKERPDPGPTGWARPGWVLGRSDLAWATARSPNEVRKVGPLRAVAYLDDREAAARVIASGLGVGLLPAFLGDESPDLTRWGQGYSFGTVPLSALYLPTARHDHRVRAVVEAAARLLEPALAGAPAARVPAERRGEQAGG